MSRDEQAEKADRAAARAKWPVKVYRLGEEPSDNQLETTTAGERLAMVWEITKDTWALSGRQIPEYERHEMPGRVISIRGKKVGEES